MAASSYAWSTTLSAVVSNGGEAVVPTPGFETPENYKTDEAEVVRGGTVLRPEEFSAAWNGEFTEVALTNQTETDWMPGDTIFVTVAGTPFDTENIESSFDALEARVTKNETDIKALDTRVAALETTPPAKAPVAPTTQPAAKAEVKSTQHQQQAVHPNPQHPQQAPKPAPQSAPKPAPKK